MNFYQLQTVTSFQFGKSSVKVDDYFSKLVKLDYQGGGVSDFNSLLSFPYLYQASKKYNLKPIFSSVIKINIRDIYLDICLVILNETGYRNLVYLNNYAKEIYQVDDLINHLDGLACILKTEDERFKQIDFLNRNNLAFNDLSKMFDIFFFGIEIYSKQDQVNVVNLRDFISNHSYLSLAFNKVCYLDNSSFYRSYKILEAIINKANISNDEYDSFDKSGPFFLLSKKVLESIYTLEEISNQEKLVSSIHFDFNSKRGELIRFTSINAKDELKRLAYEGLKNKLNELDERYVARLEYELKIINQMNFNDYFLLVADYVNYFRKAGVKIGPGRGSCVGSLVAYALDIVQIDPIKYNLYFERFLNPSRHGLPDIDIDVEDDKRNDVITYLKNKYGANKVGLILTYSTLQLKAAIRRIGMVFNQIPPSRINLLVNSLPNKPIKLEEELANNYRFKKLIQDPYFASILDKAKLILDYPISFSTHASGVIISSDDLFNKVPVSISNINIINYEFKFLEDMGYLKLDVLGLSNLTFIKQIEHLIELDDKKLVNPYLDLENKKTYEILNKLLVIDIFQLESAGIQQVISQIKPNNILDIAVILALYRPGPKKNVPIYASRKNNKISYKLITPKLLPILESTYGILIYQEQILEIAKQIAGFSPEKADIFRVVVSKKQLDKMHQLKQEFVQGCIKYSQLTSLQAEQIFAEIEEFANYGFNKSHAIAYSFITYTLLYYKANYPEEFYKVSLDKASLGEAKFRMICHELMEFSYDVKNPDINISNFETRFLNGHFYLGFSKIRSFSSKLADQILAERDKNGEFKSLSDFVFRVNIGEFSSVELTNLINSGCLDCFNYPRSELDKQIQNLEMAHKFSTSYNEDFLPVIENKYKPFTIDDFINEYLSLGVSLSYKLADFIQGERTYPNLFIVLDNPQYFEEQTRLTLISKYGKEVIYFPQVIQLKKGDIISINKLRPVKYIDEPMKIKKERKKDV